MDINLMLTILFGVLGIYEWWKRSKLEKINRQNTWSFYRDASVILAALQGLQEKIKRYNDADCMFELGKTTSHAENLMINQIRLINVYEKITKAKIEKWLKSDKICGTGHLDVFNKLAE